MRALATKRSRRRAALIVGVALSSCAGVALGAGTPLTVLPRPAFAPPVTAVPTAGPPSLALLSSRYQDPSDSPAGPRLAWPAPRAFRGQPLHRVILQGGTAFLLYGENGIARYLVGASNRTHRLRYAFDFDTFIRPPRARAGDEELVDEGVEWAREQDGVLYVETSHLTYADASYGRNGYIAAVDLRTRKILWRSRALVANARTFVLAGDFIVSGYGFTMEPDYLYVLDRRTGRAITRLVLPSAPERIVRRGSRLYVRTYDHELVVALRP
jgi:hypothetical protein